MVLGHIGGAHGIQGWTRVSSYTDPPERLLDYKVWRLRRRDQQDLLEMRVAQGHWDGKQLRARFEGIDDRTAAEVLNGCEVLVWRTELPATAPGEYYQADLIGCRVINLAGVELGTVAYFVEAAQTVMVVQGSGEHWIPAGPPHLKTVRLDEREIEVDWPEDL